MPQRYNIQMPNLFDEYEKGVDRARADRAYEAEQRRNAFLSSAFRQYTNPATGEVDRNALLGAASQAGYGPESLALNKEFQEQEKARIANFAEELKNQRALLPGVRDQKSLDAFRANVTSRLGAEMASFIPETFTEEGIRRLSLTAAEFNEQLYRDIDYGGFKLTAASPKYGPPSATPVLIGATSMTPYEEGRLAIERREAEQRAAKEEGGIAETVTDASGNVRFFDKSGREIVPVTAQGMQTPVRGKPTATYEKAELARTNLMRDTGMAISQLQEALKPGGLLDTATGSGAGRMVDVTAGFFGKATPGAIATGQLQPIADLVLKLVPRFEGPQSDKDTQSYREAAGQLADSTLPNEIRRAAAETIIRLMEARRNQFTYEGGGSMGGGGDEVDSSNPLLR